MDQKTVVRLDRVAQHLVMRGQRQPHLIGGRPPIDGSNPSKIAQDLR